MDYNTEKKERAVEQIEERIIWLQDIINTVGHESKAYKINIRSSNDVNVVNSLERRINDNKEIIKDTKKDIEALSLVIDILSTNFPSAEVNR